MKGPTGQQPLPERSYQYCQYNHQFLLLQKRNVFGHAGVGGQLGAADPYYKLGWGYCTNYTNPIALFSVDHRYQALQDAMQECVRALHTKAAM